MWETHEAVRGSRRHGSVLLPQAVSEHPPVKVGVGSDRGGVQDIIRRYFRDVEEFVRLLDSVVQVPGGLRGRPGEVRCRHVCLLRSLPPGVSGGAGAGRSRFEQSLGAMHLAGRMMEPRSVRRDPLLNPGVCAPISSPTAVPAPESPPDEGPCAGIAPAPGRLRLNRLPTAVSAPGWPSQLRSR